MQTLNELVLWLDERTQRRQIADFPGAYNGLQFAANGPIRGIAATVDASLPALKAAVEAGANLVLAHHGLFWNTPCPVVGSLYEKYRFLIQANCAVYSSHLPLDSHEAIGNNVLIAKALGLSVLGRWGAYEGTAIGVIAGGIETRSQLKERLVGCFPNMIAIEMGPENPRKIGISSGSGAGLMDRLGREGIDTFITGELRQAHFAQAQEEGLNLYICGHYATEVFGIQALGQELATRYSLPFHFIPSTCPL